MYSITGFKAPKYIHHSIGALYSNSRCYINEYYVRNEIQAKKQIYDDDVSPKIDNCLATVAMAEAHCSNHMPSVCV